jgi:hypothetical protein
MKMPTQAEAQGWIELAAEQIERAETRANAGLAQRDQRFHTSCASDHASMARAQFLHGDALADIRASFHRAAELMEISFIMAYDDASPLYIGNTDRVEWADVDEVCCLDMMNWALLSKDFAYAVSVAHWVRPSPDNQPMGIEVCNYVYALKHCLLGDWQQADDLISDTFRRHPNGEPPKRGYPRNYYTLSWALAGIIRQDDTLFNDGLARQLAFYRGYAEGEAADTDEQYFCDNANALAVLARKSGRTLTVSGDYLADRLFADIP